jgi:hypothetical protein
MALTSAYEDWSRIISSSSIPTVYAGPLNFGSISGRVQYEANRRHDDAR